MNLSDQIIHQTLKFVGKCDGLIFTISQTDASIAIAVKYVINRHKILMSPILYPNVYKK
jgi:hypothetical protein